MLTVVMALSATTVSAQRPTYRAETELVTVNVTVEDGGNEHVRDLTHEQFEIFEDGVPQELAFFAAGEMPLDVAILIDTSSSMGMALPLVQQAASRFVHALRPGDRASVLGISGGTRVLASLTPDRSALLGAIAATRAGGGTPLYAALYATLHELRRAVTAEGAARRQAIVLLSDGYDTGRGFGFAELLPIVRRHAVPIYVVAPRSETTRPQRRNGNDQRPQAERVADFELKQLAVETGARAFFPASLSELVGIYADIADELAHQYSLGYQSSNPNLDGAFRRIAVRVVRPAVRWRARAGYVAN